MAEDAVAHDALAERTRQRFAQRVAVVALQGFARGVLIQSARFFDKLYFFERRGGGEVEHTAQREFTLFVVFRGCLFGLMLF